MINMIINKTKQNVNILPPSKGDVVQFKYKKTFKNEHILDAINYAYNYADYNKYCHVNEWGHKEYEYADYYTPAITDDMDALPELFEEKWGFGSIFKEEFLEMFEGREVWGKGKKISFPLLHRKYNSINRTEITCDTVGDPYDNTYLFRIIIKDKETYESLKAYFKDSDLVLSAYIEKYVNICVDQYLEQYFKAYPELEPKDSLIGVPF